MNECENIWNRIVANSNQIVLKTKRGLQLKYEVRDKKVFWIPMEDTMNTLFPQSDTEICNCLMNRRLNLNPSEYGGTATSYKWALLNHPSIWIAD